MAGRRMEELHQHERSSPSCNFPYVLPDCKLTYAEYAAGSAYTDDAWSLCLLSLGIVATAINILQICRIWGFCCLRPNQQSGPLLPIQRVLYPSLLLASLVFTLKAIDLEGERGILPYSVVQAADGLLNVTLYGLYFFILILLRSIVTHFGGDSEVHVPPLLWRRWVLFMLPVVGIESTSTVLACLYARSHQSLWWGFDCVLLSLILFLSIAYGCRVLSRVSRRLRDSWLSMTNVLEVAGVPAPMTQPGDIAVPRWWRRPCRAWKDRPRYERMGFILLGTALLAALFELFIGISTMVSRNASDWLEYSICMQAGGRPSICKPSGITEHFRNLLVPVLLLLFTFCFWRIKRQMPPAEVTAACRVANAPLSAFGKAPTRGFSLDSTSDYSQGFTPKTEKLSEMDVIVNDLMPA